MPLAELERGGEDSKKAQAVYDPRRTTQILQAVTHPKRDMPPEEARITVHHAVSRISVLYEKLRNAVEYREEHLLRKSAIVRILKRQFILEKDPVVISHQLVRELIAARYLPNETLPETIVDDAAVVVRKYQAIQEANVGGDRHMKWVMGVVATELEELLADSSREKAIVTFLYEQLKDKIRVRSDMDEHERHLQIYVACYRSLIRADEDGVSYKYLRAYLPDWNRPNEWVDRPAAVAERLLALDQVIHDRLRDPVVVRFQRAVKPWAVSLWMLTDALEGEQDKGMLLSSKESVRVAVSHIVERRERQARAKLRRGTVRAIIYLFITKMLIALLLEVPIEIFVYGEVARVPLAINILFPVVLMFFVGVLIKRPGAANRTRILQGVDELLGGTVPSQELRVPRMRKGFSLFFFRMVYFFMFVISFGLLGSIVWNLGFSLIAIVIFFFFLTLVSFFGYRLRQTSDEILVVKPRERLSTAIIDFLTLPILRAGRWLSVTVSRLNVFAFIFDVIFEAPLKLFLHAMEESLKFIKEKKEELTEER